MGQAQINVRTRACSGTFIARTKQAALTHNVRGKELNPTERFDYPINNHDNRCLIRQGKGDAQHGKRLLRKATAHQGDGTVDVRFRSKYYGRFDLQSLRY